MKKLISLSLAVVIAVTAFAGCSNSKDSAKAKTEDSKLAQTEQTKTTEDTRPAADTDKKSGGSSMPTAAKVYKVALYFPDKEAMGVKKEERDVAVESEPQDSAQKAKICIEELIKGSMTGLSNSIPKTTKLMSVKQDKDTLIVDLSREFEADHNGGSAGVLMTMSQLVLSLTEIDGIKKVSFKVEGRTLEEFKGSIEFNKPFERSEYEQYISK